MKDFVGIGCGPNQIAVIALANGFAAPSSWANSGTHVLVYDLTGKQLADIAAPMGAGFNDLVYDGKGIYYAADSAGGGVFSVDVANKKIALWYYDAKFAPNPAGSTAANGVRYRNGWVYFSSGPLNGMFKIQVGPDGKPMGSAVAVETGIRPDNGDVTADGSFYVPSGTTLYKVSPAGDVTKFADPIQGAATALVSTDGKWLYLPTRGGTDNQRVVRLALP
jgi:sugar lactone lactonase YvrE